MSSSILHHRLRSLNQTILQTQFLFTHIPSLQSLLQHTRFHNTNTQSQEQQSTTVNKKEAKKFADLSDQWWNLDGPFKPLHQLNPTRCSFILSSLSDHFNLIQNNSTTNNNTGTTSVNKALPLHGLKILDVGCGGGLLSESLARYGAFVHGIDVNEEGLAVARHHASLDPGIADRVVYKKTTVEDIAMAAVQDNNSNNNSNSNSTSNSNSDDSSNTTNNNTTTNNNNTTTTTTTYDAVIASEVIEHVENVPQFCTALVQSTAPGGAIIISTMNRTPRAYMLAVVAAENILGMVPQGTHEWSKFITPEELTLVMEESGAELMQMAGMVYNPVSGEWVLMRDVNVNYIAYFRKKEGI